MSGHADGVRVAFILVWVVVFGTVLFGCFMMSFIALMQAIEDKYDVWDRLNEWIKERLP